MAVDDDLEPVQGNPFASKDDDLEPVTGNPFTRPPGALLDRAEHGTAIMAALGRVGADMKEGFGTEQLGFSPESEDALRKSGIFHDPDSGRAGPIRFANEALLKPAAAMADAVFRGISAGVYGAGGIAREMASDAGFSQGETEQARAETINALNFAMMRGDANHPLSRATMTHNKRLMPTDVAPATDVKIGGLPAPQDFHDAANVISDGATSPALVTKLQRLYQERGLHPAEIASDAVESPRLRQDLLADHSDLPEPYANRTAADGTPSENVTPDLDLLTHGLADPRTVPYETVRPYRVQNKAPGQIATRVTRDGRVIPAPEEVADYLKDFGKEAGFTYAIGPETPSMFEGRGPQFQQDFAKDIATGETIVHRQVYMPDNSDMLTRRWYGLGTAEILYHEVGHALDYTQLRAGMSAAARNVVDPALKAEMTEVSQRFRPKLWEINPAYNSTPSELYADTVAAYLSNPTERARMPLFKALYGDKLDKYVAMADKYMPKKVEDGWVPPETEAGAGGGGRGDGGGGGFSMGDGEPLEHTPRMIEGPKMTPDEARDSLLSHISIDNNIDTSKKLTWSRVYTNMVDKFHPMAQAVKHAVKDGLTISTDQDPYKLARLFAGWSGKALHMLEKGTVDFFDTNTNKTLGPGLKQILGDVKDDLDGFRAFVAAARAKELELRGIITGFDPRAVMGYMTRENITKYAPVMEKLVKYQNEVSAYLRDSGVLSDKMYDAMLDANKLFVPFHVAIDHANVGIQQVGKELQATNPVRKIKGSDAPKIDPLESVVKNTYLMVAMAEKNVVASKMVDLLFGTSKEAKPLQIEGPRPKIGTDVGEYLGDLGVSKEHAQDLQEMLNDMGARDREGEISRYVNGVRETYHVDSDLANAMHGLNSEVLGTFEKLLQPLTSTLRAGAVLTPDFMTRHIFRDSIYAFVTTTKGIFTPIDTARGIAGIIKEAPAAQRMTNLMRNWTGLALRDPDFWNWQLNGGGNTSMVHLDRDYLQEDVHRLTDQTGLFTRAKNVVIDPNSSFVDKTGAVLGTPFKAVGRYVIHPLQVGTELVTSATHLGAFKKAVRYYDGESGPTKANLQDAAWVSRDTAVDAARIGAKMQGYNSISAFANIKVQDTDRIMRLLIDKPAQGALRIGLGITLPSLLLWYANKDDSRYQQLPEWEKDVFWIITTDKWEDATPEQAQIRLAAGADQVRQVEGGGYQVNNGHIFRLPKPFAAGVIFGSGPERTADKFYHSKGFGEAFKGFFGSVAETTIGGVLPTPLQPLVDQAQNRVTYTGRTLIPAAQEKLLPEYQYTEYTTETAKAVARVVSEFPGMGVRADRSSSMLGGTARALSSPILIENYVRAFTGGLGMYALNATDLGLRKMGLVPDPPKPVGTLADVPYVRAFTVRYPSATTQNIQDFYDRYDQQKTFYDTWQAKAKEGDADAIERIRRLGGDGVFMKLEGTKKALGEQSQIIHNIYKNPSIAPAEKRQLIDGLYYAMISSGNLGKTQMDQIDEGLKKNPQQP